MSLVKRLCRVSGRDRKCSTVRLGKDFFYNFWCEWVVWGFAWDDTYYVSASALGFGSATRVYVTTPAEWFRLGYDERRERIEDMLKRPDQSRKAASPGFQLRGTLVENFPTVAAMLFEELYDDGTARRTATLTLFKNEQGALGATMNDRDNARALFGAGDSLESVLANLEAQLGQPSPPWRNDKAKTGNARRQ